MTVFTRYRKDDPCYNARFNPNDVSTSTDVDGRAVAVAGGSWSHYKYSSSGPELTNYSYCPTVCLRGFEVLPGSYCV